jgi:hypothetical protein
VRAEGSHITDRKISEEGTKTELWQQKRKIQPRNWKEKGHQDPVQTPRAKARSMPDTTEEETGIQD